MKRDTPVWWTPENRPNWWLRLVPGRYSQAAEVVRDGKDEVLIAFYWPPGTRKEITVLAPKSEVRLREVPE